MIRYFAHHPTAANLLMLLIIVAGLSALPRLKRETFPHFLPREVSVSVVYPGASAEDIEEAICQRLEDAVDGVSRVAEVRSEAREGLGRVEIEMQEGADFQSFLNDIRSAVDAIDDLPQNAETPVITEMHTTDPVIAITVAADGTAAPEIKAWAERMKDRLQAHDLVSLVEVSGFSDHQLRIEVPAVAAQQTGLSLAELAGVVARQSMDQPAGLLQSPEADMRLRFLDERRGVHDLENLIVVGGREGGEVRLGDLARITDRFEFEEEKILVREPGSSEQRRAALLQVQKTRDEDVLTVLSAVQEFVEAEQLAAPPSVTLGLTRDSASVVRDRLVMLIKNGWQGLLLVFLTLWLFFNFRFSFWVAMGLPVSFLGAMFFMAWAGYSLNMITLVALLVALGLLMDDAIVISENIARHVQSGKPAGEAAVAGAREVWPGVLSSFLTTVAVFGPITFLEGRIGKVLRVMPGTLIFVLAVSLIEAFWILPHHLSHSLAKRGLGQRGRLRRRVDQAMEWARDRLVGGAAAWAVRRRWLFAGILGGLFLMSMGLLAGGRVKFIAFPEIDGDVLEARLILPQGTPLARTEQVVERMLAALDEVNDHLSPMQPDGQSLVRNILIEFNKNPDAYSSGAHLATITIDLLGAESRRGRLDDVQQLWRERIGAIPDIVSLHFTEPALGPAGRAFEIRLQGQDLDKMNAASMDMQTWLGSFRGVHDVAGDLFPGKPEIRLRLREGAMALGLSARDLAGQLSAAWQGRVAQDIQVGPEAYEISVILAEEDRQSLGQLENFRVALPGGAFTPLTAVAVLEPGRSWSRIARVNGRRTISIRADVDVREANSNEIIQLMKSEFLGPFSDRHPDVKVSFEGEAKESKTTGRSMLMGFALGLVGIFIILSFQFRSYLEPLAVMMAIPLALIGVVWGHWLMGYSLSMPSLLGFVALSGVVVNNSILLVHFLKERRREGRPVGEAAVLASRERFRAILLTSATTIAGLLPLLTERSLQAQVLIPLAISLVFGLLASAILVLLVIPALFTILDDLKLTSKIIDTSSSS